MKKTFLPFSFEKKVTIYILLFFLQIQICQSQSGIYHPFPVAYSGWKEQSGGYQSGECKDWKNRITGDTIWNGLVYHKIQKKGVRYWMDNYGFCTNQVVSSFNYYAGAYRNDSLNKRVYFLPGSSQRDTLLYDFNLNQYEPLPHTYLYNSTPGHYSYVSKIDSVLVGSEYHKRLCIASNSNTDYVYLIEGIGSTFGLLERITPPLESYTALLCFEQNGAAVYPFANGTCGIYTGVVSDFQDESEAQIIPNPVHNDARVVLNNISSPAFLNVYNVFGKNCFHDEILNGTILHLESLSEGLYFYQITNGEILVCNGKFIKTVD